ncbi:hypothetical protein [Pleurocapsa sp. FMAR1]|nr:hypothetical protein [Pleurocapsa sp. FMAR1]
MSNICRFTVPASRDIESIIAMKLISWLKPKVGLNRLKMLGREFIL